MCISFIYIDELILLGKAHLLNLIVNVIVHEILIINTNRPESRNFIRSEIAEYRGQTEKIAEEYNWNNEDKDYVEKKALQKAKEKLSLKYPDVKYNESMLKEILAQIIIDFM